jgi:hypothetical protein
MATWHLWYQVLTELYKEILQRHFRVPDDELVAITAPQSIWYSLEIFRPNTSDPPIRKVIAYWAAENRIDVHIPGSLVPTRFPVRIDQGIATFEGKTPADFVSLVLGPFTHT